MALSNQEFGFGIHNDWITQSSPCYRPPSWPPPADWVVSVDRDGNVVSRYGDNFWDFSLIAGRPFKLNFGFNTEGRYFKSPTIDPENANLLRRVISWRMWGPRALSKPATLWNEFLLYRSIFALCSREGILGSELTRFPKVLDALAKAIQPSHYKVALNRLHRLYDARDALGFVLVDISGIKHLASACPDHTVVQTPYIPPRIWDYQIFRLRECLEDFLAHRQQVEACFDFCLDAYASNYGSLEKALTIGRNGKFGPFNKMTLEYAGCTYMGPFYQTAERFGVRRLLEKWLDFNKETGLCISQFTTYLSQVSLAGLAYITNFSMQRKEEAASLRVDCLQWERDEKFGQVPILRGETTKTDQDSDARWVVPPSIEIAIDAMATIAQLRMRCAIANPNVKPSQADIANPYLYSCANEPWSGSSTRSYLLRSPIGGLNSLLKRYPKLFDIAQLRITKDDLKIAQLLTPNLPDGDFSEGCIWPLAWHQYRRTTAVNMFASGILSDSSIQWMMKHTTPQMSLYYGRGYSRLRLNEEVEEVVTKEMYLSLARDIRVALDERFVSPHSPARKAALLVNLISEKDEKALTACAKRGTVSFRRIGFGLGACLKNGPCEFGGVESLVRCLGGDGAKPCADLLCDRDQAPQAQQRLGELEAEMSQLLPGSPRHRAKQAECRGLENFIDVITR